MSHVEQRPARGAQSIGKPIVGRRKQKSKARKEAAPQTTGQTTGAAPARETRAQGWAIPALVLAAALAAGAWAYAPTMLNLAATWNREPDYSHGFLVLPLAVFFLWARRGTFPGFGPASPVLGLALLTMALAMRYLSGRFFFDFLDGWSVIPWLAGTVAIAGGRRLLWWSLPSIGFLWFMVPLPFGWETMLSLPLQKVATKLSCFGLQLLGQPAFADGNVIQLGEHELEVAQACSGLRLFVSVVALAYAYVILVRRTIWEKAILILSLVPIAILANAIRIVVTGLLFQYTSGETAHKFAHDFSGWAMIPLAAAMFWCVLWYLGRLIREEEVMEMSTLVRES
jgi:exosortase